VNGPEIDAEAAASFWKQMLTQIGDMTANFAARADSVAISGPNRLVVSFRKAYTQAQQYCERSEPRQRLEETFSRLAGRRFRIDFATLPDGPAAAETARQEPARPVASRRQKQQELMRHPLIRKANELFDTEVIAMLDAPAAEQADAVPASAGLDS
jgi:DNA polymerase-3 subunit gamma/tau